MLLCWVQYPNFSLHLYTQLHQFLPQTPTDRQNRIHLFLISALTMKTIASVLHLASLASTTTGLSYLRTSMLCISSITNQPSYPNGPVDSVQSLLSTIMQPSRYLPVNGYLLDSGRMIKIEENPHAQLCEEITIKSLSLSASTIPHVSPQTEQAHLKPEAKKQFDSFDEQHEELAAMFPSDPWQLDRPNINSQTIKISQLHTNLPIPQWMHSDDVLKNHIPSLFTPKK